MTSRRRSRPLPCFAESSREADMSALDRATEGECDLRDGMRIDWDAAIEMDDGLVLRADVFRPVEPGRYPAILSYGPYGKGLAFQEGYRTAWELMAAKYPDVTAGSTNKYQNWEVVDPEKWVPDGYVCVRVDSRGAGRSPGYIDHNSPRESKDLYDCIEWAASQAWSNARIGLNGISYYASNQWRVAGLNPPHLAAICIWEGWSDYYRDGARHGGIACTFRKNWQDMQVKTVQHGRGERGPRSRLTGGLVCGPETLSEEELAKNRADMWAEILQHPLDSE
jgi:putative CocE/NonD family hydrolase